MKIKIIHALLVSFLLCMPTIGLGIILSLPYEVIGKWWMFPAYGSSMVIIGAVTWFFIECNLGRSNDFKG